ncbi:MAG TPA: bacterioferritin, partial [Deltaproteobacteria bacterium]|nr:bacterioferritin [Deltaproteobacteria bacterium]
NQYFIHAKMTQNWGYSKLAEHIHHESIDEMKDADKVIERILYLDGVPNMQRYNPVRVGETVEEMHRLDLAVEADAIDRLNRAIARCREVGDNGSRVMLEEILTGEEEHYDELAGRLERIEQMGIENYLATQV